MKKAYLDANILIAYVMGAKKEDEQFHKAEKIFQSIKNGEYLGVVSTLTLMEIQGVFRNIKGAEAMHLKGISQEKLTEFVISGSDALYNQIIGELLQMPNLKLEQGGTTNFQKILTQAQETMNGIRGVVKFYNYCNRCNSSVSVCVHKAVATVDILHAFLAKDVKCDLLLTFDKGFKELIGHEKLEPLEIVVL